MTPVAGICRVCNRPVGLVHVNDDLEAYGHLANPRNGMHRVLLSRTADDRSSATAATFEGNRRPSGREDAQTEPRERRGVVGNGSGRSHSAPSGRSSSAGRARDVGVRPPAPAPRPARSAGRSVTAGEGI